MWKLYIPALIVFVIFFLALGYSQLLQRRTHSSASNPLILYKNSGGITGLCDNLEVESDGQYSYVDDCRHVSKSGSLSDTEATQMHALSNRYGNLTYNWNDNVNHGSSDGFAGSLQFSGMGESSSDAAKIEITNFVNSVINHLK